jgi:hypothetical protein
MMMNRFENVYPPQPVVYRIEVRGCLDENWSDWLNGFQIEHGQRTTVLTCEGIDQSKLRGILCKLWDFNLTVISVIRFEHTYDKLNQ